VVTGAVGGIGRAIATSLARCGCNLALADSATAQELAAHKECVSRHHLDVSDRAAIVAFRGLVSAEHPGGRYSRQQCRVALGDTFEQLAETDFDWLFSINF
jgi:NAD(P)-dependent dehydrogenase (short-subunit alcohol dehydrogenase family)